MSKLRIKSVTTDRAVDEPGSKGTNGRFFQATKFTIRREGGEVFIATPDEKHVVSVPMSNVNCIVYETVGDVKQVA